MRISLNWLNDYVDIKNENVKEMAEKITRAGVNVEGIIDSKIDHLVVGYVEDRTNHPDSDHLNVCKVNLGDEVTQIVCGAPNVDKGQKVIVAKVGAILPGGFEIKKATIRGVESNGMICALYELGLEDKEANYHKGIHVIEANLEIGSNPLAYLGLDDTIYELDLNPNRGSDCTNHLGFAYEVAAVLNKTVTKPETKSNEIDESVNGKFTVNVNTDKCTLYKTRMVKDVVIGESPTFIKKRLKAAGMRSINNVVDISNYIMLEYGQPLHFFDKDKVGNQILVRMANENENTITLDGKERRLTTEDIVITNGNDVIAIAGVMGCANSEVDQNTKNILIESAIFNPYNVRYTSIRLDLRSEASVRFEKGLNFEYTEEALNRACYLLEQYASGKVLKDEVAFDNVNKEPKIAEVSREKINKVLGMELSNDAIAESFNRLGFTYQVNNDIYTVTIPNRRLDVSIREDLIEEVGRLYGYDNIVGKILNAPIKQGGYSEKTKFSKQLSKRMRTLGLNEVRTYTLVSNDEAKMLNANNEETIYLSLPMSSDKSAIRHSIIHSLLKAVDYNLARNIKDINIYEISNVYSKINNEYIEETKLAIAMTGNYIWNSWTQKGINVDFYTIKGITENMLEYLGLNNRYTIKKDDNLPIELHPYQSAKILVDGKEIGYIGKIHPKLSKNNIYVLEVSLNKLFNIKTSKLKYKPYSIFPTVSKDVAFILDKDVEAGNVMEAIRKAGGSILTNIDVFDVYQGTNVGEDKKSLAFNLVFSDPTKTLTDEEVTIKMNNIINEVSSKLNGKVRDK